MIMATYETLKTVIFNKYDTRYPLNNQESLFTLYMCKFYLMASNRLFTNCNYTMTALKGNDFSSSTKEVYDVVIRQPAKFLVLSMVSILNYFIHSKIFYKLFHYFNRYQTSQWEL